MKGKRGEKGAEEKSETHRSWCLKLKEGRKEGRKEGKHLIFVRVKVKSQVLTQELQ